MRIQHVKQKCNMSCTIACIAMVSGRSFDEIVEIAGKRSLGLQEIENVLLDLEIEYFLQIYPKLYTGNVYIVNAPSLISLGINHSVVIDTRIGDAWATIYDPVEGWDGKKIYTAETLKSWSEVIRIEIN